MITPLMTSEIKPTMATTPLKPNQRAYAKLYSQGTIIIEPPQREYEGGNGRNKFAYHGK